MILKKHNNVKKTRKSSDDKFYSARRVTNDILAVILKFYLKKRDDIKIKENIKFIIHKK
jgi:hypothetical protein